MNYDFSRFSTQSFEHLVQALAAASLGARIQVFGAGRDGAREATYRGRCHIIDNEWNGYVVFQAKYHAIEESPARNAQWLIKEIDKELIKFADPRRALPKPDYYVLATNVRLSASAPDHRGKGKGGIDRVTEHLDLWAKKLRIQAIHLWHADTLSSLLDVHEGVRTSYSSWVLPSDLLAQVLRSMAGPERQDTLSQYLRVEIHESRDIKTHDIGQAIGRTVRLDEVFVDLPVRIHARAAETTIETEAVDTQQSGDLGEDEDWQERPIDRNQSDYGVVGQLMRLAADKFDPQAWAYEPTDKSSTNHRGGPLPNRIVLLGGPGQGKSSVGQFLAQLARARFLEQTEQLLSPELREIANEILATAKSQRVPLDGPIRYPFHVSLPDFADELNVAVQNGKHLSIIGYIAQHISSSAEDVLDTPTLRRWLGQLPSILILDGLDEVPASGNRSDVLRAIAQLAENLQHVNADSVLFVTSRPQGYQNELSSKLWGHWSLSLLGREEALNLAGRVAPILITDSVRRREILKTLDRAALEEATSTLLTSPLQVMLLFHLVSTRNNIPRDRWTLFQRHYEILCDREVAKGGPTGDAIGAYRSQIDRIHHDAGYLLHLRAEEAGGANAYLTMDELTSLVADHLRAEDFDDVDRLSIYISNLATNRLVFLRCQVEDQVAFDVRSLQEFMAAARITTSPEDRIICRLRAIAGRAHWLHVFRIACSKILASTGHEALRDPLIAMFDELDIGERSADDQLLQSGALMALQLLQDGSAASSPVYRKKLLARASKLLTTPDTKTRMLLAEAIDVSQATLLEPAFISALSRGEFARKYALQVLAVMTRVEDHQFGWTKRILSDNWPETPEAVLRTFDAAKFLVGDADFVDRIRQAQWRSPPEVVRTWQNDVIFTEAGEPDLPEDIFVLEDRPSKGLARLISDDGSLTGLLLGFLRMSGASRVDEVPDGAVPAWHLARAAGRFADSPSIATAEHFLSGIISTETLAEARKLELPWVLHRLLADVTDLKSLDVRRAELLTGTHGDELLWAKAEARWLGDGVTLADLVATQASTGISSMIDTVGAPPIVAKRSERTRSPLDASSALRAFASQAPSTPWIDEIVFYYVARRPVTIDTDMEIFLINAVAPSAERLSARNLYIACLLRAMAQSKEPSRLLQRLLSVLPLNTIVHVADPGALTSVIKTFAADESRRELIPVIASLARYRLRRAVSAIRGSIPDSAFERLPSDSDAVLSGVAALRLLFSIDSATVSTDVQNAFRSGSIFSPGLISSLNHRSKQYVAVAREVLLRQKEELSERAYEILHAASEARPVRMWDADCAVELALPRPLPSASS